MTDNELSSLWDKILLIFKICGIKDSYIQLKIIYFGFISDVFG